MTLSFFSIHAPTTGLKTLRIHALARDCHHRCGRTALRGNKVLCQLLQDKTKRGSVNIKHFYYGHRRGFAKDVPLNVVTD